jgi:hypothetical protein
LPLPQLNRWKNQVSSFTADPGRLISLYSYCRHYWIFYYSSLLVPCHPGPPWQNRHTDGRIPQTAKHRVRLVLQSPIHVCRIQSHPCLRAAVRGESSIGAVDANNMSRSTDRFGMFASTPGPCPPAQVQGGQISSHRRSFAGHARHIDIETRPFFLLACGGSSG